MYLYLVLIICAILAASTVWKEYQGGKLRLGWRIFASLIAVVALACIALPVSYPGEKKLPVNEAVLLTDGFNSDSLTSFKNDSLLTADPIIKKKNPKVKLITLDQLKTISPAVTRLHIFGYGLSKTELKELDSIPVIFHPETAPSGITAINWTGHVKQGQPLKVQGTFANTSGKLVRLMLKGLNTTVDSAVIAPQSTSKFNLTDLPKGLGQSVYHLVAVTGKDTLFGESLPTIIDPVKPLKILLLADAPGFENKFLKNWLADNGFAVVIRSAITKDKFSSAFINMEQIPVTSLSASLLDKFDVVISDLSVIHSLGANESSVLKQQVNQKGIGLIIKADTTFTNSLWVQNGFPLYKAVVKDVKPLSLIIDGKKTEARSSDQLFIGNQNSTQALVNDEQIRVSAALNIAGGGKVVFTTLGDTYTWMLNGDKADYSAFWSLLISKAAKSVPQTEVWQTLSGVPSVNEPVQLGLETSAQANQISADSLTLAPGQNDKIPFLWQATWWPQSAGWHSPKVNGGAAGAVYVFDAGEWKTLKALGKIAGTKKYAESINSADIVTKQIHPKTGIPVPKGYFYALLLLACTWLWIEDKARPKA